MADSTSSRARMTRDIGAGSASSGSPLAPPKASPCVLDRLDLARPRAHAAAESPIQGPRVAALGDVGEPFGAPPEEQREDDDPADADHAERHVDRCRKALERLLAEVADQPEDRGPHDAARGVPGEEALPLHLPDAREERGVRAQDGDEAAEEDDLPAVPLEHVARDLQMPVVDAQLRAVAD